MQATMGLCSVWHGQVARKGTVTVEKTSCHDLLVGCKKFSQGVALVSAGELPNEASCSPCSTNAFERYVLLQQSSTDRCVSHTRCRMRGTQHLLACHFLPHNCCSLHQYNRHLFLLHRSPLFLPLPPLLPSTALLQRRAPSCLSARRFRQPAHL